MMNIAADGTRVSSVRAFQGTRCVDVKLITDGGIKDIAADKEVILAAGASHSPKLLMLSGVGEATALCSLGIDVVENLSGVGENQDHVAVTSLS